MREASARRKTRNPFINTSAESRMLRQLLEALSRPSSGQRLWAYLAPLNEGEPCPALLKRRPEMRHNPHVVKLPDPLVPDIPVMIRRGSPYRLVAIGIGAGLQEIPGATCRVTVDLDDGTENMVESKGDALTRTPEELPNGLASLVTTEHPAIPDRINGEEVGQGIGIIVGIAIGSVPRFQLLDVLQILQPTDAALERFQIHCTLLLPRRCDRRRSLVPVAVLRHHERSPQSRETTAPRTPCSPQHSDAIGRVGAGPWELSGALKSIAFSFL